MRKVFHRGVPGRLYRRSVVGGAEIGESKSTDLQAGPAQAGWRVMTLKWFQQTWPKAKVREINAAIGGTPCGLGVFRLQQEVRRRGHARGGRHGAGRYR